LLLLLLLPGLLLLLLASFACVDTEFACHKDCGHALQWQVLLLP